MKRFLIFTFSLIFLIISLVGCNLTSDKPSDKTVVKIGFQAIPNTEAIAKANGWHEETIKNADIQWFSFDAGRDVNNALAAGSIDIGMLGSTLVATGLSKQIDYEVIWIADLIAKNEGLAVRNNSGINSMNDLKGKTIAVTFGSTTHYTFLASLKTSNISENDLTIIDMRPPDMLAAWKRADIDGGYVWQPTLQYMIEDQGKLLIDSGALIKDGYMTADVIVVRKEFAKQHPEIVKDYIASQIRAVKEFRNNPNEAAMAVAKEFQITPESALSMMNELIWLDGEEQLSPEYLGTSTKIGGFAKTLEDTTRFLESKKFIEFVPPSSDFDSAINPEFIENAME